MPIMDDQPQYYGVVAQLGDLQDVAVDPYFTTTPIAEWSLRHFLRTHDDHAPFTDSLIIINSRRTVDRAIRSYTKAWISYLAGETGKLRLELSRRDATADIVSDIISNEERRLAQQKLRKRMSKMIVVSVILSLYFDRHLLELLLTI